MPTVTVSSKSVRPSVREAFFVSSESSAATRREATRLLKTRKRARSWMVSEKRTQGYRARKSRELVPQDRTASSSLHIEWRKCGRPNCHCRRRRAPWPLHRSALAREWQAEESLPFRPVSWRRSCLRRRRIARCRRRLSRIFGSLRSVNPHGSVTQRRPK